MKLTTILCAIVAAFSGTLAAAETKPHIIFILADDLGWSDTTLYGTTKLYQTPNLERLAQRGMLFTRAYAASPLCSPTRASILTGMNPARIGITAPNCHLPQVALQPVVREKTPPTSKATLVDSATRLDTRHVTLTERLQAAGYTTGHFGKWHLGPEPYSPLQHGFDVDVPHWPGPGPAGSFVAPWKFKDFKERTPGEHIEDRIGDEAVAFIAAHKDKPFFLNYWQFSVHAPFDAKRELIEKYRPLIDPQSPQRSPTYAAMVQSLDDNVGKMLGALDRFGLADKTAVIFFSDNGGNMYNAVDGTTPTSNAPLRGGKASMFEGGVRVPAIVSWPGVTEAGVRSDAMIQSTDFYPTILNLLGLPPTPNHPLDGKDITPALRGETFDRGPIFTYFPHQPGVPDNLPPSVSVHRGDWKLIRLFYEGEKGAHAYHLYNLKDDLGETNNLSSDKPELVKELDALIETFLADTSAVVPKHNPNYNPNAPAGKAVKVKKATATPANAKRPSRIFVGGVAGIKDLLQPEHSERFREAGGGLYLHNNGWAELQPSQQRKLLQVFASRPVAIELGFRPSAEAWARRFKTSYAALGITPDFICANAFDNNHRPTPEDWQNYSRTLRSEGGVPESTRILPTFEYANFAPNIPKIAQNKISQVMEFQEIIRGAGGLALDVPCGYFFGREQNYRDWILDALQWTHRAGLRTVLIASPHRSGEQFDEDAQRYVAYLQERDALPDTFVCENYQPNAPADYPNPLGTESVPHTILGVAMNLAALLDAASSAPSPWLTS